MLTLNEMKAKRKVALDAAKALNDSIAEGEDFTEEQQAQFDTYIAESKELEASITKIEAARARGDVVNAALGVAFADPPTPLPNPARGEPGVIPAAADPGASVRVEVGRDNLALDPRGGYSSKTVAPGKFDAKAFADFAVDVVGAGKNQFSDRFTAWHQASMEAAAGDGLQTGTGAEGGYTVPVEFSARIWEKGLEAAVIRPRAMKIPMSSQRVLFPKVNDTTHATNVFGGVAAYFTAEEAQFTSSKPAFGTVALDNHKLTALAYVSGEMLQFSSISVASWLPQKLGQAITWKEEQKFLTGTGGAGEPTGIHTSGAVVSITKEDEQVADTILFNNIIKMAARIWNPESPNIVWIANRTCEPQLAKLAQTFAGGGGTNVFLQDGMIVRAPGKVLYDWPLLFTEHAETLGDAGDLTLANLDEYIIGDYVGGMQLERSIHLKFDFDQEAFRIITRVGGMSPWAEAFQPENGDTLSPFITLAAR